MLSATAALGLIHMWDVDGGLVPIDKYMYATEEYVKSGAFLAIGLVNCGVRCDTDPAYALLEEHVNAESQVLRVGATLGLGIAYSASRRDDVTAKLYSNLEDPISNKKNRKKKHT